MQEAYRTIRTARGKTVKVYDRRSKEKRRRQRQKWLRSPAGRRYQRKQRIRQQRIKQGSIRINRKRSRQLKAARAHQKKNKSRYQIRKWTGPRF